MEAIVIAVFSVTVVGVSCAVMLCVANKVMYVKVDERLVLLTEAMPGVNCGACGYPGCSAYAEALINDGAKVNLCTPGGTETLAKLSAILGVEVEALVPKSAIVNCLGDSAAQQKKMEYKGIQTCNAAKQVFGGEGACAFGCLGYGDCQSACPTSAICMEDGLARINGRLCNGCGLCVKSCPVKLITIENADIPVIVLCSNIEKGAVVRKKCTKGCIACGKCARECPDAAIVVQENLARIDYSKCSGCGRCVEVCITKCISHYARRA